MRYVAACVRSGSTFWKAADTGKYLAKTKLRTAHDSAVPGRQEVRFYHRPPFSNTAHFCECVGPEVFLSCLIVWVSGSISMHQVLVLELGIASRNGGGGGAEGPNSCDMRNCTILIGHTWKAPAAAVPCTAAVPV